MEELILDSGIKKIAIKDADGEMLTVLRINVTDARTAERFAGLIDKLNGLSDDAMKKRAEMDSRYAGRPMISEDSDEVDIEQVLERSRVDIDYLQQCIVELEAVFGAGMVREVYRDAYAMDPDFVPDEAALVELVDKLVPVMSNLFEQRFNTVKAKYNAGRRGKHTKSKDELIREYRSKHE